MIGQVCLAAKELDELIVANLAMIDRTMLRYFIAAIAHSRVLHQAYEGKLGQDADAFKRYVYPKSFDSVVSLKRNSLINRRAYLIIIFRGTTLLLRALNFPLIRNMILNGSLIQIIDWLSFFKLIRS